MNVLLFVAAPFLFASNTSRVLFTPDDTASRNATVNAAGARRIDVEAHAGDLRIEGRAGITEVRVRGVARASDPDDLEDIKLIADRSGDVVRIRADIPDHSWGNRWRALDMVIEVPDNIPLDVEDGSGNAEFIGTAALELDDGSGNITIRDAKGLVRVEDGSGNIEIDKTTGDIEIEDGSGEIDIRDVQGSVIISEDGSGNIDVRGVSGAVRVRDDGSGGITAEDVGGDFVVESDGSGGVRHRNVKGTVRVPRDSR